MARDPVRLMMVTDQNNNKFYNMDDNGNGTLTVTYGRVGTDGSKKIYSIGDWEKILRSKLNKGYKDISNLKITKQTVGITSITDPEIQSLLDDLLQSSRQFSSNYYNIESAISKKQIDEAQIYLNNMAKNIDDTTTPPDRLLREFNRNLIQVFTVLPRKIKRVEDQLCHDLSKRSHILQMEQALLDNLSLQAVQTSSTATTGQTYFDMYGFKMEPVTPEEEEMIKQKLSDIGSSRFSRAWKCTKPERDEGFEEYLKNNNLKNNSKNIKMYWHGSGVENIFSIAATALQIRPTNVSYSGSAFGDGIYSAPSCAKAYNYTNAGNINGRRVRYMFINAVITGNMFDVTNNYDRLGNIRICDLNGEKFSQNNLGYHSVYAHATSNSYIRRDEVIVYNQNQVASRYLVEIFA